MKTFDNKRVAHFFRTHAYLSLAIALVATIAGILVVLGLFTDIDLNRFGAKPAATVNDQVITVAALDANVEVLRIQSPQMFDVEQNGIAIDEIRRIVLDQMIDDALIQQEAERRGIEVTAEEITDQVDGRRMAMGDPEDFDAALEEEGMDMPMLRSQIKISMLTERLREELNDSDEAWFTLMESLRSSADIVVKDKRIENLEIDRTGVMGEAGELE